MLITTKTMMIITIIKKKHQLLTTTIATPPTTPPPIIPPHPTATTHPRQCTPTTCSRPRPQPYHTKLMTRRSLRLISLPPPPLNPHKSHSSIILNPPSSPPPSTLPPVYKKKCNCDKDNSGRSDGDNDDTHGRRNRQNIKK